jgi:hypothetical protein
MFNIFSAQMEDIELFVPILDCGRSHAGPILTPCNLCWDTTGLKLDLFDLFFTFFTVFLRYFWCEEIGSSEAKLAQTNFRYRLGVNMGANVAASYPSKIAQCKTTSNQPIWAQSSGNATPEYRFDLGLARAWTYTVQYNTMYVCVYIYIPCAFCLVFSWTTWNMTTLALKNLCWCRQCWHLDLFWAYLSRMLSPC